MKPDGYFQVGECMVLHPEFHIIEQRLQFDGNLVWRDPNVSFRRSVFTGPFPHLTELYRPYPKYKLWACHKMTNGENFYLSQMRLMFLAIISSAMSVRICGSSSSWSSNAMFVLTLDRIASAFLWACRLIVSCRLLLGIKP